MITITAPVLEGNPKKPFFIRKSNLINALNYRIKNYLFYKTGDIGRSIMWSRSLALISTKSTGLEAAITIRYMREKRTK
jgi:hypothetical protein